MSYDLAVYSVKSPVSVARAAKLYAAGLAADGDDALAARPGVAAFHRALVAKFPELDDDADESPFAATIDRARRVLVVPISFSRADEVLEVMERLAHEHRVQGYDPQKRRVFGLGSAAPAPPDAKTAKDVKLSPKDGQAAFVAAITPGLAERGFRPAPKDKLAFVRETRGVVHGVRLNLGMREVRTDVVLGSAAALALANEARPKEVPSRVRPLPTALLSSLHYAGWLPGRPFREDDDRDDRFEHEVCHTWCVAKSTRRFLVTFDEYVAPLFAATATPEALLAFFERAKPFEKPRANWSNGLAESMWNPGVAIVHRVATRLALGKRESAAKDRTKLAGWIAKKRFGVDASERAWLDAVLKPRG